MNIESHCSSAKNDAHRPVLMNVFSFSAFHHLVLISVLVTLIVSSRSLQAAPAFTLQQVIDSALQHNPSVNIARAQEDAALAAVTTSKAYMNPEVEFGIGPSRYRSGNNEVKSNWGVGLSQTLEYSDVRNARQSIAESNVKVAGVGREITRVELRSRVKDAFYNVLQRQSVLKLVDEDRHLLQQIRERVKLRADVGEAPRYELIKAETESLAAERDYQAALARVLEAKAYLHGLIGSEMPSDYELTGELPLGDSLPSLVSLREKIEQSPQLQQIRAASEAADAKLQLEERLRNPGLTLKAGMDQDPDMTNMRFGIAIPLPLWSQRQGQIAEAAAGVRQVQAILNDRTLALHRDIESAYQRYLIAQQQVAAFEHGLLSQSESVLKTAEAAYRFGERGILDYLDAQRTFRSVRKDYLTARYDYVSAMLETERLLGAEIFPTN
ncbi:cobalt-zinc-cadmium resistance protein CzcC precursor [mine drainage metagenome]|uniref:Cobalt-zinc-cadmium resistance protein CzcC n=1 Tax=mine drainage metagenome TaxID=410659 RepID=A0A1J5SFA8_9ZZZZ